MTISITRGLRGIALGLALALPSWALAGPQFVDESGYAVSGYDVVAYWSLEQAPVGQPDLVRRKYPFTAAEYDFFAKRFKKPLEVIFRDFIDAGLGSLPGGGAEVLVERIRQELYPKKIGAERWLEIVRIAHNLGLRSNATLLYGHVETPAERVEHHIGPAVRAQLVAELDSPDADPHGRAIPPESDAEH